MNNVIFYSIVIFIIIGAVFGFGVAFLLLLVELFVYFIIKSNKKDVEISEINLNEIKEDIEEHELPYPGDGYSYYAIVGMQYRNLNMSDVGIQNNALAIAEPNNPYDAFAVGIYRKTDSGYKKLVGYVPMSDNEELHDYINEKYKGKTKAIYQIWKQDEKFYGEAWIKDDNFLDEDDEDIDSTEC